MIPSNNLNTPFGYDNLLHVWDDFIRVAGHELRTPLTSLSLQLGLLSRTLASDSPLPRERVRKFCAIADRQLATMKELVENLIDAAQLMHGDVYLKRTRLDLSAITTDCVARFSARAAAAGSEIRVNLPESPVEGLWDARLIQNTILNIIGNAVKFGRGKPIEISVQCEESSASFHIRDGGIGIRPDMHARVFERFRRAVSPDMVSGMGLGLFIVREVVLAHGGVLHLASGREGGTHLGFSLPREPEQHLFRLPSPQ